MNGICTRLLMVVLAAMMPVLIMLPAQEERVLFIVFMAARNDLGPYAGRNIKQLQASTPSDHVKIFVRLDSKKPGKTAKTKQFFIENNALKLTGTQEYRDSGDGDSLVETIQTAYTNFPAEKVVLVIWNHGTGGIEPAVLKALNPSELFHFNAKENRIELERSIGFIDYITRGSPYENETKGIGFDDSSGNYLTIKKLTGALRKATTHILKKKISVLACDACMMAGIDVISGFQDSVEYFVGSQEVVLGTGYNYDLLLKPLLLKKIPCNELFASHCVAAFKKTYGSITEDYTHCAIDVSYVNRLEKNIDTLAQLLIEGLDRQHQASVKAALRKSRRKTACTHFKEPTYIDIDNLYENLLDSLDGCSLTNPDETAPFKERLSTLLTEGRSIIHQMVKANAVGAHLKRARGISVYFPEYIIHKSYFNNAFAAKRTHWLEFLKKYRAT
ncbi:hypothetical protein H0W26_05045 [Candidatus Dependentiae bacterium]|nr:hypothetical protein [Candidatus Dependentiae bacterium]